MYVVYGCVASIDLIIEIQQAQLYACFSVVSQSFFSKKPYYDAHSDHVYTVLWCYYYGNITISFIPYERIIIINKSQQFIFNYSIWLTPKINVLYWLFGFC